MSKIDHHEGMKACEPSKAEQRRSHMGGEDGKEEMYSQTEVWAFEGTRMALAPV